MTPVTVNTSKGAITIAHEAGNEPAVVHVRLGSGLLGFTVFLTREQAGAIAAALRTAAGETQ